jgi:hypothetical protein
VIPRFSLLLYRFKSPKGAKTEMVTSAIERTMGPFRIADIHKDCPGVSLDMIRWVFKRLKETGELNVLDGDKMNMAEKEIGNELGKMCSATLSLSFLQAPKSWDRLRAPSCQQAGRESFVDSMNFASAVRAINKLLRSLRPVRFCSSWIRCHAPDVYCFIKKNVRAESGGIDWDRFTRALDRKLQRKWQPSRMGRLPQGFRDRRAVEAILRKYHDKFYTFLAPANEQDRQIRDTISIALVRIAQRGNLIAKREIMKLLRHTVDDWIEQYPKIARWEGRDDLVEGHIEGCIRRYRYSGTFIGYLFKTLKYAGRGLRPRIAYSLDDDLYSGKKRGDRVGFDPETNAIVVVYG